VTFANPLPWWALLLCVSAAGLVAWHAYRRFAAWPGRRYTLSAIRFVTLLFLIVVLMRPVARSSDADARDAVVPILVDTSRSMGLEDVGGTRRIDRARELLTKELLPTLDGRFRTEILAFGEALSPSSTGDLGASARRSDLGGALAAARERYRGRPVAGIVLLSDGGDTGRTVERGGAEAPAPVYAFGVGSPTIANDREVLSVTAAEAILDESRVDLAVLAVSHGSGSEPIELRLLENGRPIEVRHIRPAPGAGPVREVFQVAPANGAATVYSVEIPAVAGELVPENNVRSVLVQPPARTRRVLLLEGAPGFEHSFLKRAIAADPGLELDSVVRKGINEQGAQTFYIQAARSRSVALESGFPPNAASLFAYDAIVLGNVAGDQLSNSQLESVREFVSRRGGGLLVLGAQSFQQKGLLGTPVEAALPVALNQRSDTAVGASGSRAANRVALTAAGLQHPIMQLAAAADETRKRWDAMPPLAAAASSGSARPGAAVLATTSGAGGVSRALVAVQRYGEGRSMIFTGEASWRWRMMMPSSDRMYDTFWRQAVRWLALGSADPVALVAVAPTSPGDEVAVRVAVRDTSFQPQRDAQVTIRVTGPDGRAREAGASLEEASDSSTAVFAARFTPEQPGIYKVSARARRGGADSGAASSSFLVGGADVEMTDPRLNTPVLARLALGSGGRVLASGQTSELLAALRANVPAATLAVRRDLWHNGWSLLAIIGLLASEWVTRRRWGLR
jgi:uncharacterized membrane protein